MSRYLRRLHDRSVEDTVNSREFAGGRKFRTAVIRGHGLADVKGSFSAGRDLRFSAAWSRRRLPGSLRMLGAGQLPTFGAGARMAAKRSDGLFTAHATR
jgi:hypothetical protein